MHHGVFDRLLELQPPLKPIVGVFVPGHLKSSVRAVSPFALPFFLSFPNRGPRRACSLGCKGICFSYAYVICTNPSSFFLAPGQSALARFDSVGICPASIISCPLSIFAS